MSDTAKKSKCACKSNDAERCLSMRLDYFDAMEAMAEGEKCQCPCHEEYEAEMRELYPDDWEERL